MLGSARRGIQYPNPDRSDRPDIPSHLLNLVNALEVDLIYDQGLNADRLARSHLEGVMFYETDTGAFYYDDGVNWHAVGVTSGQINLSGVYASRPPFGSVPVGTTYFATDSLGTFRTDGSAWVLVQQMALPVVPGNLGLVPGPYDGQEVALIVDATNGIKWRFRYNSSSASVYKWEFVGGSALTASIDTQEAPVSTGAWSDAATVGPSITIPRAGQYRYIAEATGNGTANTSPSSQIGVVVGANTPANNDQSGVIGGNAGTKDMHTITRSPRVYAISDNLRMRYKLTTDMQVSMRYLSIVPERVS